MNSPSRSRRYILFILAAAIAAIAAIAFIYYSPAPNAGKTPAAPPATPQRVSIANGLTVIALGAATQVQSGIRVESLPATIHRTEVTAYGTVLDLQPLIEFRARYVPALADLDATKAAVAASRQEFERTRALYQDNQNISLKAFQAARAAFLADQAKLVSATDNARIIRGAAQQQFGEPLAHWALDPHSPQFERLLDRQDVLLRVTLPPGANVQAPAAISVTANSMQRLPASLVSPAAQSDPAVQGSAFIYRAAAPIAAGTSIVAYLPTSNRAAQGVFIPASAIVWYGGQPWVYVQMQPNRFARRPVSQQSPLNGGYFVTDGIKVGEGIVVAGAQILLSEEMRPPPGSSACKDPECD